MDLRFRVYSGSIVSGVRGRYPPAAEEASGSRPAERAGSGEVRLLKVHRALHQGLRHFAPE